MEERQICMPCQSVVYQNSSKLKRRQLNESHSLEDFKYTWEKLDWKEKKILVTSLVELNTVKRQSAGAEESRGLFQKAGLT